MMKKALITGVTGQDGAYLSQFLLDRGYRIYGTVRGSLPLNTENLKFLGVEDRVDVIPVNLLDLDQVMKLLRDIRPDEIYNLAAQSSVGLSFRYPVETIQFNTLSVLNLLETVRSLSLKTKFYQASSSEMFGKVDTLPVTEKTTLHPVSPYAISKASGHWMTINYREAYGLFCCCGILFNHESVLRGKQFVTKKILATAVRISKGSKEKLTLGNIHIQRDWGYAPEYVKAMWLMLQQQTPDDFIIATNQAHSLEEFVSLAFDILDLNWKEHVEIDRGLYRPSDIEIISGDPKKAREKFKWGYDISFRGLVERLIEEERRYQDMPVNAKSIISEGKKIVSVRNLRVSIITPSYNQGRYIREAIESVRQQGYPDFEHIVVDNCSTDDTIEILKEYPHLLWRSEPDQGQSDALNKGFKMATGDIIGWLNADDRYIGGCFSTVTTFFKDKADYDIVYGDYRLIDENGQLRQLRRELAFDMFILKYLHVLCVPSTTTFFKRKVLDEGWFLDTTYHYSMDYEFFLRLALRGYRFAHVRSFLADFRWHAGSKSVLAQKKQRAEQLKALLAQDRFLGEICPAPIRPLTRSLLMGLACTKRYFLKTCNGCYLTQWHHKGNGGHQTK